MDPCAAGIWGNFAAQGVPAVAGWTQVDAASPAHALSPPPPPAHPPPATHPGVVAPATFELLWQSLPVCGAFDAQLVALPAPGALVSFLRTGARCEVVASGEVHGQEKVYVMASRGGVRFLAEIVLHRASQAAFFRCKVEPRERADTAGAFVSALDLGAVLTPLQGTVRETWAERSALGLATY